MPNILIRLLFFLLFAQAALHSLRAQTYSIEVPQRQVPANQYFQIKAVSEGAPIRDLDDFPNIPGFQRAHQQTSTMMQVINGQRSARYEVIQMYAPTKEGSFTIPSFSLKINDGKASFAGTTVRVTAPVQQQRRRSIFDPFFGGGTTAPSRPQEEDYIEVKDNAFFSIASNKKEVYQGEGFMLTVAFYIAEGNRVVKFGEDLGEQLEKIIQNIKPDNCWEEVIDLKGSNAQHVTIQGKPYRKITFYKAMYFPFNQEAIEIPAQGVEMIKFKVSRQRDIFGRAYGKRGEKYFYSQPVTVKVKPLPPHPLREQVAVGQFRLSESADKDFAETGESISYRFEVQGTGNANALNAPKTPETHIFDIYPPNSLTTIQRSGEQLLSRRRFDYQLVLNEPGKHPLSHFFEWVYFDPTRQTYDTLRSQIVIRGRGESRRNVAIASNTLDNFYDRLVHQDNSLTALRNSSSINWVLNISLLLFILLTGYFILRR